MPRDGLAALRTVVDDEQAAHAAIAAQVHWLRVATVAAGALTLGVALLGGTRWLALPRIIPALVLVAVIGAIVWRARRQRLGATDAQAVAEAIEREQRLRRGSLRVANEVAGTGPLGDHAAVLTARALSGTAVPRAPEAMRALADARQISLRWCAAATLAMVMSALVWPDGLQAVLNPVGAWRGSLLPALTVEAPTVALRGSTPRVRVRATGRRALTLLITKSDGRVLRDELTVQGDTVSRALPVLENDVDVAVTDGRARSVPMHIRVTDKPYLGDVIVRAAYPAYLGRADEDVALAGVLVLPRGTTLTLSAHASVPVRDVELTSTAGERVALDAAGDAVRGVLRAERSGRWTWRATGTPPLQELPAAFALDVRPDSAPQVQISTTSDTVLLAGATASVNVLAMDDHALASVTLTVRSGETVVARRDVLTERGPSFEGAIPLDLDALGLQSSDAVLRVDVTATDGSPWRQVGRSRTLVLRRAGVSERREQARAMADSVAASAASLAKQQQQLAQQTGDAARSAKAGGEAGQPMSFDAREKAQQMAQQQRALQQQAQQLQQQARQLADQLKGANALDSALAGRLAEAQQMMQQALSPQMMQRLQQLEQSAQKMDQQATRQSLDDLARQQQALREQLERNAEMLKRAALEGSMETLRDEAQDLAKAQQQMADSSGQMSATDRARQAERLARENEQLSRDIASLTKRLREADAQRGAQRAEQARQNSDAANRQMQDATKGDADAAKQAAQRAAQQTQQAADQLKQAREDQVNDWKQETTSELDQSIQEMMQLSQQERQMAEAAKQQELQSQASQMSPEQRSGNAQKMAADQASLQNGVKQAAQRLQDAARRSQHVSQGSQRAMQEALQRAQDATQQAQKASGQSGAQQESSGGTSAAMRDAAEAMERAASSLVRDRERAARAQSASGLPEMMEEMQQLAKQQQQVNGQAAGMSMMPGGESGAQAQQMAQAIARKQRQIAQRLDDVGGADASGRADALAREAKRLADAMERAASDPETAARREQFLQRLLDAGRTLRREDEDTQGPRESKPGIGTAAYTPPGTAATGAPASRVAPPSWDELKGLRDDERRAVLDYFEKLNKAAGKPE
jgi:hypothetical protein